MNKAPRILCIGMPVRDLTFGVQAVPGRGQKFHANRFAQISGGNALNAAIGISRLGGRASLTGPMGDAAEAPSRYIFEDLAKEGVESTHLVQMPGLVTPISAIMMDQSGERTIVSFRDPRLWKVKLPNADVLLKDCDAVLIESRCASFATDLCAEARQRGIPVVVDIDSEMARDEGLLTASSHLIFSEEALQATAGISGDAAALREMEKLTESFLAVTLGPKGAVWLDDECALRRAPAFPVDTVDTLGAGDIFHGAFALAITERQSVPQAIRFASAAAALKCTRYGGAFAAPERTEVEALVKQTAGNGRD